MKHDEALHGAATKIDGRPWRLERIAGTAVHSGPTGVVCLGEAYEALELDAESGHDAFAFTPDAALPLTAVRASRTLESGRIAAHTVGLLVGDPTAPGPWARSMRGTGAERVMTLDSGELAVATTIGAHTLRALLDDDSELERLMNELEDAHAVGAVFVDDLVDGVVFVSGQADSFPCWSKTTNTGHLAGVYVDLQV